VNANGTEAVFSSGGELNVQIQNNLTVDVQSIEFGTKVSVLPRYDSRSGRIELEITADVSDLDACGAYQDLEVSFAGGEAQAVVTSYQCGSAHVDSTGQSPGSSSVPVPVDTPLRLRFGVETQPESVEVRIYPGASVSASFFMWPEDLPTGVEPVARFERLASPEFEILPGIPKGEYSMVIRAVWEGDIEVFCALNFRLE